jgi:hypothetical protein
MKLYQSLFVLFGLIVVARAANFYEFDLDDPYSPIFNSQQPVALKVGDSVRFVVDENLSTGYQWKYKSNSERGI